MNSFGQKLFPYCGFKFINLPVFNSLLVACSTATLGSSFTDYFAIPLLIISFIFLVAFTLIARVRAALPNLENYQLLWIVLLIAYCVIWALSIQRSVGAEISDFERPAKLAAGALVAFYLCKVGVRSWSILLGASLYIILNFIKADFDSVRTGLGINPNAFGYLSIALSLSLFSFSVFYKGPIKLLIYGLSIIGLTVSFLSGTRGIFIVISIFAVSFFWIYRSIFNFKGLSLVFFAILSLGVLLFQTERVQLRWDQTVAELESIKQGNLNTSIGVRFYLYKIGISQGLQAPIFGASENVSDLISVYQSRNPDEIIPKEVNYHSDLHNQYIDSFARRGFLGLVSFIFLLIVPIVFVKNDMRPLYLGIATTLGGGALVDTPLASGNFLLLLGISMSALIAMRENAFSRQ